MISPTDDSFKRSLLRLALPFTAFSVAFDRKKKKIHLSTDKACLEESLQLAPKSYSGDNPRKKFCETIHAHDKENE